MFNPPGARLPVAYRSATRVSQILKVNRRITADTALRLSRFFGTSAKFWLGLQNDYDIEEEKAAEQKELEDIRSHTQSRCH